MRKSIHFMNPLKSVGMKLFIIFFVSIVMFVFVSGYISYTVSKQILEEKISDASHTTVTLASQKVDLMLKSYEQMTAELVTGTDFKLNVSHLSNKKNTSIERLQHQRQLLDTISNRVNINSMISSIALIPLNQEDLPAISYMNMEVKIDRNSDSYKRVLEGNGHAIWLGISENQFIGNSNNPVITLGRTIKSITTNEMEYMLVLQIKIGAIDEMFKDVHISDSSAIQIVNNENELYFSTHLSEMFQPSSVEFRASVTEEPYIAMDQNGTEQIVAYHRSEYMGWNVMAISPVEELVRDTNVIENATLIIAGTAALLAIVIGYFIANMIGKPLRKLRDLMLKGAEGNLAIRTETSRSDEIGQVGAGFNQMIEQITLLVEQTNRSAQDVLATAAELSEASKQTSISAKEIAVATDQIANGASDLAIDAEKGNEIAFRMGVKMKNVMNSNAEMGESASEVRKASEQGTIFMNELIAKTIVTEELTRNMVDKVDKLKESTASIRQILELLNSITKQTNILSLNATIEAARAGAAGKGFMVIADEIRKLADQSKQSIHVVGQIVETIQNEINETVNVLSEAYPIFEAQIHAVKETDLIFKNVQIQMGGFETCLNEVTDSIQQLDQSQTVLSEAMSNVSTIAQQSSAASEEVASLSSQQLTISEDLVGLSARLDALSSALKDSLSRFHI
ncbi:methyl-accepting chemotaxis protein [Cohnella silvisoli]|uniref:Methyl-accepting chemotaxis protein n=1 Tax=Cohnella silvisoli TaxID=2873699 RepID=A0ABV1KS26_9BACL|nr:methyl-accepting chemotaxis protein [Cohnella silvisoli]MCD9022044.1 methyl-accepting chemotaxis protein [Cohnella silvisoli]